MINCSGYTVEIDSSGKHTKSEARNFAAIIEILKSTQNGHIAVTRRRDGFEVFCGKISEARWKFGLGSNVKYRGNI